MDTAVFAIIFTCLTLLWMWKKYKAPHPLSKLPSPPEWPLMGHLFKIHPTKPFVTFRKWSQQLGGIFVVRMPRERCVVINSPDLLSEMLIGRGWDFAESSKSFRTAYLSDGYMNIGFRIHPDSDWKQMRKVFMNAMRQFGTGLDKLENVTHEVIQEKMHTILNLEGKPFDPKDICEDAICNIQNISATGKKLPEGSKELEVLKVIVSDFFEGMVETPANQLLEAFPILQYFGHPTMKWLNCFLEIKQELMDTIVADARETFDADNEDRCMLDGLFRAQQTEMAADGEPLLTDAAFRGLVTDIFAPGIGTSTAALYSIIYFLACYQDEQKKAQQDILNVLGSRLPSLNDRSKLPYVVAVFKEAFRYGSMVPIDVVHVAVEDSQLGGYQIPKGTWVFANTYTADHDERYWLDPWKFDPARFLDGDGNLLPNNHQNMKNIFVFGGGPRGCPGKAFAMARVFLIVTSILQKFSIQPEDEKKPMEVNFDEFEFNTIHVPAPYNVRMIPL